MIISKQKSALFFRLSISITVFGALFKYMSWPLLILGATGMVIFHAIQLFQKPNRSPLDYSRQLLIVAFLCNSLFGVFEFRYDFILTIVTKTALIAFLAFYIKDIIPTLKANADSTNLFSFFCTEKLSYILADLATVYIVVASLFKVLNWEIGIINSNFLLIIGLIAALTSIISGLKDSKV